MTPTEIFAEMLDVIEFEICKYEDGYGLNDLQGANLGDIEEERFTTAEEIIDRLDVYITDYYFTDLEETAESEYDIDFREVEVPQSAEEWVVFMNTHEKFKSAYQHEYAVMHMIAYNADKVDLEEIV